MMRDRQSLMFLIIIMTVVVASAGGVGIHVLYNAAFGQQRARLAEIANSQALLIESMARFDSLSRGQDYPEGKEGAIMRQVLDAHRRFEGFGETGELKLGKRNGDWIIFFLAHRMQNSDTPEPIAFDSKLAQPMRLALQGKSGTTIDLDYRGEWVLAAYTPIEGLNWGIVAKTDIQEIRVPFIQAGMIAGGVALSAILIGALFFYRITNPFFKRLVSSEATTRNVIDTAVDGIITINSKGIMQSFNPAAEKIFQYTSEECVGRNIGHLMPAPYAAEHDSYIDRHIETSVNKVIGIGREMLGKRKDGQQFPVQLSVSEFIVDHERMYTGFIQDISERKEMEAKVRENEAEIRAIVETAEDAIITINEQGRIESVNSSVERLFGYGHAETIGKDVSLFFPEPDNKAHDKRIINYLNSIDEKIVDFGRETVGRRKDDTVFPLRFAIREFFLGERRMFAGYIHDLTEQKTLQEQILQSERLAVIGKMAAKVAHELRNPLSSISLNAEILDEEIDALDSGIRDEAKVLLGAIMVEIDRVSKLTDEYLHFSRLPKSSPLEGNLNTVVVEVLGILNQELKQKGIKLSTRGLKEELFLLFDKNQIQRVLLNIVRNAMESMLQGGELNVWTKKTDMHAAVYIRDTGIGIPENLVGSIFEPFFTTKDFGTGLGLAITQQIVHEHCGEIFCDSKDGAGTTFRIELPVT